MIALALFKSQYITPKLILSATHPTRWISGKKALSELSFQDIGEPWSVNSASSCPQSLVTIVGGRHLVFPGPDKSSHELPGYIHDAHGCKHQTW